MWVCVIASEIFFTCEEKKKGGNPEKDYDSAGWKAAQTKKSKIPYWGKSDIFLYWPVIFSN